MAREKKLLYSKKMSAKILAILLICMALSVSFAACKLDDSLDKAAIYDYYREYCYELPFSYQNPTASSGTYFSSSLNLEQMADEINKTDDEAILYDIEGAKRVFITVKRGVYSYYFIIYDAIFNSSTDNAEGRYFLRDASREYVVQTTQDDECYVFLFPDHLSASIDSAKVKMYCTFDEFANFYQTTGKSDTQIDIENKTVIFMCAGSTEKNGVNVNWARGKILLQYVEDIDGNYVNISKIT